MNMRKLWAVLLAAAMVLAVCAGCAKEEGETGDGSITVTDMKGREVTLDKPAERIVALTPSDCEILYAIGAGDKLVGRGTYCDYPAEVLDVTEVKSGEETNIEQIIALKPDVLLMSDMSQTEEQVKQLEDAGIRVLVSEAQDIAGVYDSIGIIGKLMGKEDKAAEVVQDMKDTFADIEKKVKEDSGKSIYFEISPLQWGLWSAGAHTFMDEVAQMLKVKNCFADVEGFAAVSEEQVLTRNPDYILTITMYFGEGPKPVDEILARKGWQDVTAVKDQKILNLVGNELSRPSPRLAEGAKILYDFIYGEAK